MKIDKIVGCMIGLAVGDALGVPVEFMDREAIREKYGLLDKMVGGGTWGQKAGTTSDDTAMALAVAEGIIKKPADPVPAIGKNFEKWYLTQPFDIGICSSCVIREARRNGFNWFKASRDFDDMSGGRSGGNGGLMRTAFVGLYYHRIGTVKEYAKNICKMTHWNKDAQNDCALMSMIINVLVDDGTKRDIEDIVMSFPEEKEKRYNLGVIEGYPFMVEPSGSSRNSMACALKCVLTTRTFRDAVLMAVNMGGDTDTIGAITGAIAGALYGADSIPKDWINALDDNVVDRIVKVCTGCAVHRMGGVENVVDRVREWIKGDIPEGNKDSIGCRHEG